MLTKESQNEKEYTLHGSIYMRIDKTNYAERNYNNVCGGLTVKSTKVLPGMR